MSDSYLGATEGELLGAPAAAAFCGLQRSAAAVPHQGALQLTPRTLALGG